MCKITGKTFEYKSELKAAGFAWNAESKTWDREESLTEENGWRVLRGVQCGDLRYAATDLDSARFADANERTKAALIFEGGY